MIEDFSETDHGKLLVTACRFLKAADVLKRSEEYKKNRILFTPALHLAAQGVEVLLKANLVGAGHALDDIRKKYGHNILKLWVDERNQLLREEASLEAGKVWKQAKADGEWSDQFGQNPKELLEEYIKALNYLHTSDSEYALRYIAKPGMEGPRVHLLVDTFLYVAHFCLGQPYALVRGG